MVLFPFGAIKDAIYFTIQIKSPIQQILFDLQLQKHHHPCHVQKAFVRLVIMCICFLQYFLSKHQSKLNFIEKEHCFSALTAC